MALIYLNANDKICCTVDNNPYITEETVGKGRIFSIPNADWRVWQYNNDNKIVDGKFVPNHIPDRDYWLDGKQHTLVYPDTLPEGATFDKPLEITATEVREKRDEMLRWSDWSMFPDVPFTDTQRNEWKAYRQKLRDIPQQEGFPEDITYPAPPVAPPEQEM